VAGVSFVKDSKRSNGEPLQRRICVESSGRQQVNRGSSTLVFVIYNSAM
jgi:hypothetical protein